MMRKRRLKSLSDLRKYLAHVLNQYERNEADEGKVKTVSYALNILAGIIRDADLESRVADLERALEQDSGKSRLQSTAKIG